MLVHNAELAEKDCAIPRDHIFVCDSGDVLEITPGGARKNGRIQVGGVMYDDSGSIVSEVVLKDRIHMSQEGIFVVMLTVQRGTGRLLTSPDIISRGFIYLRDSEELMNLIRQYLKQKVARSFGGKKVDMDVLKKEIKDEITHLLYDQTRRTPIVIPVINEVGGGRVAPAAPAKPARREARPGRSRSRRSSTHDAAATPEAAPAEYKRPPAKKFPPKQVPDTEVAEPKNHREVPAY